MRNLLLIPTFEVFFLLAIEAQAAPVHLRCEYLENPIGIDVATPHFSWQSDNSERDWHQIAYQILVASSPDYLKKGIADVWDSGKQNSSESVGIPYGGLKLESRKRYHWAVRVWDSKGQQSQSSALAWWEMGLLRKSDWIAKWINWKNPEGDADRAGIRWIWVSGEDALHATPKSVGVFHTEIKLDELPKDASLFLLAAISKPRSMVTPRVPRETGMSSTART